MDGILLVEDNADTQILVRAALQEFGRLDIANNIEEALTLFAQHSHSLLLIDVGLPDGSGFDLCSRILTEHASQRPYVIFLTGHGGLSQKITGFSLGADDYIAKPFEPLELKARVRALLRKRAENHPRTEKFEVGNLSLNVPNQQAELRVGNTPRPLDLTPTEFKLLYLLAAQEGRIFSREQLLNTLNGGREHVLDRTIDSHLSRTRKKLAGCTHNVEAIYGVGYRFVKAA